MAARVYVGNLDPRVTAREIEDEFRVFGVLRSVWVARKPPGFAFIDFDDRRDAQDAIRELDGFGGVSSFNTTTHTFVTWYQSQQLSPHRRLVIFYYTAPMWTNSTKGGGTSALWIWLDLCGEGGEQSGQHKIFLGRSSRCCTLANTSALLAVIDLCFDLPVLLDCQGLTSAQSEFY